MTRHDAVTDDIRERASLYSLGLLEQAESAVFERHLSGCDLCRTEVREFGETVGELAFALPESTPSPRVRQELLRRITPSQVTVRASEGVWKATPFAGIDVKQLFVDLATGNATSLVRMAPGSIYPPHRHANYEHFYVLQGDVVFHDHTLGAGDFEVNAPTTDHSPVTTVGGCLVLITNNLADQLLAV
jgi:anti-sigma factor ChrR (cupin superfamily)